MILNWLRRFMMGRYGGDALNLCLLVFTFILSFIFMFIPVYWVRLLLYLPLGWAVFRMLSRNIAARQRENRAFVGFFARITGWFSKKRRRMQDKKTHRFFACPQCKQTVRVPKGKGKIEITCPRCHTTFIRKS